MRRVYKLPMKSPKCPGLFFNHINLYSLISNRAAIERNGFGDFRFCNFVHMQIKTHYGLIMFAFPPSTNTGPLWTKFEVDGSLWSWHPAVSVLSQNTPSPLGYNYHCWYCSSLTASTLVFAFIFLPSKPFFAGSSTKAYVAHLYLVRATNYF